MDDNPPSDRQNDEDARHNDPRPRSPHDQTQREANVAVPALLSVLLMTLLSVRLMSLPLNRILELRYCLSYYQVHDPAKIPAHGEIPESDCKLEDIQRKLGWMMGALDTAMQACDLVIATPMGYLADKIGRRLVLALNCTSTAVLLIWIIFVGGVQSIPTAAILAGPFLSLFGGGNNVFKSVSVALMSDLAGTETQRTTYISYFLSTDYIALLAGPMLAGVLMPHGLLLPLWTGVVLIGLGLPLLSLVPKHNSRLNRSSPPSTSLNDCIDDREQRPLLHEDRIAAETATTKPQLQQPNAHRTINFFAEYTSLIKASQNFRLVLLAKFLSSFASSSSNILALYITLRTGWSFAEVGYIYTLKGTINILLAAVIVPTCARYFTGKVSSDQGSNFVFNLISTKLALLASIIGAILVGLAATKPTIITALCIYALGSVLPIFMYAIARSPELGVLDESNEGSGFTVLVVVQAIGALLGAPTMAAVWVRAIEMGGRGLGLPYFVSAAAYAGALVVMLFVTGDGRPDARRLD
ncbi:hypothetical protein M409DRAFT_24941 [Zasmidium cellare ATCC 36951]|uniref:Major facilitator superfamily (MFS) profile domain-containing protein n=1 Tax=Zasmidium cellare ATCC 36951 TaxID=1080233 RepID=A0A6A6CBZ1_ZASCE|nr:uncharacterized protein M409DRAFT_24941 [Zasmidium cellare ATCC 36951]KAF2164541.1 hypothetical protein M409DRAFT_24941 [Zasmidium cellare ATCC 36951]